MMRRTGECESVGDHPPKSTAIPEKTNNPATGLEIRAEVWKREQRIITPDFDSSRSRRRPVLDGSIELTEASYRIGSRVQNWRGAGTRVTSLHSELFRSPEL